VEIPISSIQPNPNQPRVHFDETLLVDLAASITQIGVLQPVLVRTKGDGTYELIAGERRWRAATRAGLATIPAVVRATSDMSSVEQALVENLHRQDLTALEEAAAYSQLIDDFSLTHEQVATRVGKSRAVVSNTIRLLQLPATIQHLLAEGQLSAGHARALLGSPDRAFQEQLARRAVSEALTVRQVEEAVRERERPTTDKGGGGDDAARRGKVIAGAGVVAGTKLREPGLLELENLLADHLSTRVSVSMGASRGKVVIEFADLTDLERIYHRMTTVSDD
jgi:ParB family chromosome partitioning protein